jgi:hypothetical protein
LQGQSSKRGRKVFQTDEKTYAMSLTERVYTVIFLFVLEIAVAVWYGWKVERYKYLCTK